MVKAANFLRKNAEQFIRQISSRASVLKAQFSEIDVINYKPSYDEAAQRAVSFLDSIK
jgi:hypothetical protein